MKVSDDNLSKHRVQDIINIAKVQPNYGYQRIYTNNNQDLETKDVIFHQTIEKFYKLIPRGQLHDEVLQNYPHLQLYREDPEAYNDIQWS